jgi:hypothetical protein
MITKMMTASFALALSAAAVYASAPGHATAEKHEAAKAAAHHEAHAKAAPAHKKAHHAHHGKVDRKAAEDATQKFNASATPMPCCASAATAAA